MTPAQKLVQRCSELSGVHVRDILQDNRHAFVCRPRFALYMALHKRGWSFAKIGAALDRDRTSVRHGVARAKYTMERDPTFAAWVQELAAMPVHSFTGGDQP